MTTKSETELNSLLAATATEYAAEDRAAAEEEAYEKAVSGTVFSVRLQPHTHERVRVAAQRLHLTPSALIRQWVAEKLQAERSVEEKGDLTAAVEILARDVDRLRQIANAA